MPRFSRGTQVANFILGSEISSRSGMSDIYQAHREDRPDHPVAIKISHTDSIHSAFFEQMLIKETDLLHDLRHPGIIRIYPISLFGRRYLYGRANNLEGTPWFFVMELLMGGTLLDLMQQFHTSSSKFSIAWRVELLYQLAVTTDYLHLREVAHRDLKPENIMFRRSPVPDDLPRPVLIDFGLAEKRSLSQAVNAATLSYAAPERVRLMLGKEENKPGISDYRPADIWALGVIAYQLFSARYPFAQQANASNTGLAQQILNHEPLPHDRVVPDDIVSLINRMLQKPPQDRPTIDQIISVLETNIDLVGPRI